MTPPSSPELPPKLGSYIQVCTFLGYNYHFTKLYAPFYSFLYSWILFEHINFCGKQYIVTEGCYPHWDNWRGENDQISSFRPIKEVS